MNGLFDWFWDWRRQKRIEQITLENARERVRRGARYLDEHHPDWHRSIDAESLELSDGSHCVLGQLHGDFRLGLGRSQMINLSSAPRASLSPVAYGFKCVSNVPDEWQDRDYELLNRAWREAVRRRQEDPATTPDARGDGYAGTDLPEVAPSSRSPRRTARSNEQDEPARPLSA
jgi:hypothetical protein